MASGKTIITLKTTPETICIAFGRCKKLSHVQKVGTRLQYTAYNMMPLFQKAAIVCLYWFMWIQMAVIVKWQ